MSPLGQDGLAPPQESISDYVTWYAWKKPEAEAVVVAGRRTSYAALDQKINAASKALIAEGIEKGDRVASLAPPSLDYMVSYLATTRVGGIWLGLNPKYTCTELAYNLNDSGAKLLFSCCGNGDPAASDLAWLLENTRTLEKVIIFDGDAVMDGSFGYSEFIATGRDITDGALQSRRAACTSEDPCLIVYTSGSTGQPKGAVIPHRMMIAYAHRQQSYWPVAGFSVINYFPINHVGCALEVSIYAIAVGGVQYMEAAFDPVGTLEVMEREKITLWASVPATFLMQLALPNLFDYDLSSVELIHWSGAALPRDAIEKLQTICPRMMTNYGMTEATISTATTPTDNIGALADTVGPPFLGVELRVVDEQMNDVTPGTAGELWARSDMNMLGYWGRPEATARALSEDGWMRTGDLVTENSDGSYSFIGRKDETFKSGGYNVYPREVEIALESHPGVAQVAVVSVPDPTWSSIGVACVVPADGDGNATIASLETWCRERLANYKVPKRFIIYDALPLLPIGKVNRVALREQQTPNAASI